MDTDYIPKTAPAVISMPPEEYFGVMGYASGNQSDYVAELYVRHWSYGYDQTQLKKLLKIARELNESGRNDVTIKHLKNWMKLAQNSNMEFNRWLTFESFYGRIRDYISEDNKQQTRNLYRTGQTGQEKIKWMGNARTLVETLHPLFKNELFLVPDDITFPLFIANNFVQGKGRNKGQPFTEKTIQNEISDLENPQK